MPDMRVLKTKARQSDRRQTPSFSWGKALCSCYIIPDELVELVNQLCAEYESWCEEQKVPYIRMDDQDAKGYYRPGMIYS